MLVIRFIVLRRDGASGKRSRCCETTTMFRMVISVWVLVVAVAVGFTCWVFISRETHSAVDALAWRIMGVVRTLAVEQASAGVVDGKRWLGDFDC